MTVTARVAAGVQAIEVNVTGDDDGVEVIGIITRDALEARWKVGPSQDDLLTCFRRHSAEIETEVLRLARCKGVRRVVMKG